MATGLALAAAGVAGAQVEPPGATERPTLAPDRTMEGEIAGGQSRAYALPLKAGEYVVVLVDQRGIDLVLRAETPDGHPVVETDFRATATGEDWLSLLAEADGLYQVVLRPRVADAAPGRYAVRLIGPRPATPRDRASARAEALFAEGHTLWREGTAPSLEKATVRLQEAAAAFREAENPSLTGRALGDAGVIEWRLGHPAKALELYEQSLALRRAVHDRRGEAITLSNIGLVHKGRGDIREALQAFTEAMTIWRDIGDRQGQGLTLHNIAVAHIYLADYQPALDSLREALALSRESRSRSNEALVLTTLGFLYYALGENDLSRATLLEAQSACRSLGDRRSEALVIAELALLSYKAGRFAETTRLEEESVRLLEAAGDALAEGNVHTRLSDAYLAQGQLEPAAREATAALEIAHRTGNVDYEAAALAMLALVRSLQGRGPEARRLVDQARPLVASAGRTIGSALQAYVMADVLRRLGDLEEARRQAALAVEIIDAARGGVTAPDLRSSYLAANHQFYERLADILMRLHRLHPTAGYAAAALETIERGRARTLVELLTEGQRAVREDLPAGLLRREQDVHARIATLQAGLLTRGADTAEARSERASLVQELESAERQRQEVEEEIRHISPRYASIRYPRPLSAPALQALLEPDSALLEYAQGQAPYLFVVTREGITTYRLPDEATLRGEVSRLREAVSRPSRTRRAEYVRAARRLYDLLIAPARPVLNGKRRLLIVPDRALAFLPFEALLVRDAPAATPDDRLPYLLRRFSVAYVPSGSVLASLRQRRREVADASADRKDVVAFADPVGWTDGPPRDPGAAEPSSSPLRGMLEDLGLTDLRPLPDSRREAQGLQRLLGQRAASVYVGPAATEETVKTSPEVATARRLHFATHALVSAQRPNHSALVLSRTPGGTEDGLLQAFEIFDLKLEADLVVLSACQSGLGRELRGEGVIGLTRAFLHAGADRVAATLWEVADRSTADLMSTFYRQLEATPSTGEALRKAKLQMIAGGTFAHPYYWAAFVLVGEP